MSIETYVAIILRLYMELFLICILIGIIEALNRIRKKPLKYWWGILPCFMLYLFSAAISTFVAYVAYDDISHPNYGRYENWKLNDFILHDIKTLIIWLFIGLLLYFASKSKGIKKILKKRCIVVLIGLLAVFGLIIFIMFWQPACCISSIYR